MKLSLLLTLLAPVVAAGSLQAAAFIKFDGVDGEYSDNQHTNCIEIQSFSWGATNAIGSATSGAGAGKVQFSDMQFTASLSKATPQLLLACANTNRLPRATLYVRKSGSDANDYYTITFENLMVSSMKQASAAASWITSSTNCPPSPGNEAPEERITFVYGKLIIKYTAPDGTITTGSAESEPAR